MDNGLTIYVGGIIPEIKIYVDRWIYFEFVGIVRKLGYWEIDTIWYKDPTF